MQANSLTIERTFFLGAAGYPQFPESVRIAISWSLENETLEEAEEKATAQLYVMAERERKRRYKYMAERAAERKREQVAKAPAASEATA